MFINQFFILNSLTDNYYHIRHQNIVSIYLFAHSKTPHLFPILAY
jgi:hypothetical protein